MALDNPIEAYLRAGQAKRQNQQDMLASIQGIGQGLGQTGQALGEMGQMAQQKRQKEQWQKTINQMMQDPNMPPQIKQMMPMIGQLGQSNPAIAGEMMMSMNKGNKPGTPYTSVSGTDADTGEGLVLNKATGQVTPTGIKTKSTQGKGYGVDTAGITWESLTPQEQYVAERVYNGDTSLKDFGFRERTKFTMAANEYAKRNNLPAFQSFGGEVRGKSAQAFTSGKPAMNVLSLNTAIGHAGTAMKAYQAVGNTNQEWLNKPLNYLRTKTNDPNIIRLGVSLNALQGELATVFKGSAGTDQEIGKWMTYLSSNLTPKQAGAALPQVVELLKSRQGALGQMRSQGLSNRPGTGPLISPHAQEIINQIGGQGGQSGLSPQEQIEYDMLHKKFGGG